MGKRQPSNKMFTIVGGWSNHLKNIEDPNQTYSRWLKSVDRLFIPLFTRFYTSQVVQDFFHEQYETKFGGK